MLLYPAIGFDLDEAAALQGHTRRLSTINLTEPTANVVEKLRQLSVLSRISAS